jgi:hypothetical protein
LFQEVLLQLVQQGVRFPHVGLLHEGQVPHLIECSRPCGFEFLSECPPDGFDLLFELRPRSFDFAVEPPLASLVLIVRPRASVRESIMRESTAFFGR